MFESTKSKVAAFADDVQAAGQRAGIATKEFLVENRSTLEVVGGGAAYVAGSVVAAKATSVAGIALGAMAIFGGVTLFSVGLYRGFVESTPLDAKIQAAITTP